MGNIPQLLGVFCHLTLETWTIAAWSPFRIRVLEEAACERYRVLNAEYARLFGRPPS